MTSSIALSRDLLWATRGRSWGFRFLLSAGLADPLIEYERAFSGVSEEPTAFVRDGGATIFRITDPDGRRDSSGRVIPHEFIVLGEPASSIESIGSAVDKVWPLVSGVYADVWDAAHGPSIVDVEQRLMGKHIGPEMGASTPHEN